jgi:TatA/E family protein of Tat protein translocase
MFTDVLAPTHILLILVVALLVLGPKRLPEVGRSLGRGLRDFKDAMTHYNPESLLGDDSPPVQSVTARESELHREPPAAASTAQAGPAEAAHVASTAPLEPTVDAEAVEEAEAPAAAPAPSSAPSPPAA